MDTIPTNTLIKKTNKLTKQPREQIALEVIIESKMMKESIFTNKCEKFSIVSIMVLCFFGATYTAKFW